jgi:hypothetical protein
MASIVKERLVQGSISIVMRSNHSQWGLSIEDPMLQAVWGETENESYSPVWEQKGSGWQVTLTQGRHRWRYDEVHHELEDVLKKE